MMKSLPYIAIIIALIVSCSPAKRLGRIIEKNPELVDEYRDTIIDVKYDTIIIRKDTTIIDSVIISGEKDIDSVPYPVYVKTEVPDSDTAYTETKFARAIAYVKNRNIVVELEQKDTVLVMEFLLRDALRETTILRDSIVTITQQTAYTIKKKTKMQWYLIAAIIILILIFLIKVFKK